MGESYYSQYPYDEVASITASQVALTTDKSRATIDALIGAGIVKYEVPSGAQAIQIRARCSADGDSNVINLYGIRGYNDHYQLVATFTLTGGKQVDGDVGVFVDTIAETGSTEVWLSANVVSSQANDSIAHVAMKTHGYAAFIFIATTLNSAELQIDVAQTEL